MDAGLIHNVHDIIKVAAYLEESARQVQGKAAVACQLPHNGETMIQVGQGGTSVGPCVSVTKVW